MAILDGGPLQIVSGVIKIALPGLATHILVPITGQYTSSGVLITAGVTGCLEGTDAGYAAAEIDLNASIASAVGTGNLATLGNQIRFYEVPATQQPASRSVIS